MTKTKLKFVLFFFFFTIYLQLYSSNNHFIGLISDLNMIENSSIDKIITGLVTDENGEALIGATVLEKGTNNGTTTDVDGRFNLNVSDGATLVVSFLSYKTQEVNLNGKSIINVVLTQDSEKLDEVLITGIRASQQRSVSIKKDALGFVDAITSESAGKLPDANIAEALQRVPGVAISRTRGQGDFISIRGLGPEFARATLNGRSIVSASTSNNSVLSGGVQTGTGRATNFDVLPSDIIETIEVFKTSSAEHTEGGIGGIVNIKTIKPLNTTNKFGFNVNGKKFFDRGISPSASAYGSWSNDEKTMGAFANVSYSNRLIRQDINRSFAYSPATRSDQLVGTEFEDNVFPFSITDRIDEDRERVTASATFQWRPSDKTDITLDGTYSKRDLFYDGRQANIRTIPLSNTNTVLETIVLDQNRNIEEYTLDAPIFLNSENQTASDDLVSIGLNLEQQLGSWTATFDAAVASTKSEYNFTRSALRVPGSSDDFLTSYRIFIEDEIVQVDPLEDFNFSDPANFVTRSFTIFNVDTDDTEYSTKLDLERDLDISFFSKFKAGVRYRTRSRETEFNSFLDGLPVSPTDGPIALNLLESGAAFESNTDSDFLEGKYSNGLYDDFIFVADNQEFIGLHEQAGGIFELVFDPNESFNVTENTMAVYSQLDIDGKLGDIPVTGNVGVRLVNTSVTVEGQIQDIGLTKVDPDDPDPNAPQVTRFVGDRTAFSTESDYFNFLPSANLRFEATPNIFLRMAYSKSITRPQFTSFGGFDFNATTNVVNRAGNAELDPYKSDNYDIGMEWYTSGTGVIGISFFRKNLSSFVTTVTFDDFTALGNTWDNYSTFENQGDGSITGTEISFQQPLNFLNDKLRGFGIIANATFADGELSLNDGTPISFPGVSDFSFNSALYYDNEGRFQARLAYTFRNEFLITASDVFGQEQYNYDYGQLDASVSFRITDNFTVYGDAINLTNSKNQIFTSNPSFPAFNLERPTSYEVTGIRVALGIRGTF